MGVAAVPRARVGLVAGRVEAEALDQGHDEWHRAHAQRVEERRVAEDHAALEQILGELVARPGQVVRGEALGAGHRREQQMEVELDALTVAEVRARTQDVSRVLAVPHRDISRTRLRGSEETPFRWRGTAADRSSGCF